MTINRHTWVLVHRYAGLYMALFLFIAGVTGSVIAFNVEIDHWLNPPRPVAVRQQPMLDALQLLARAEALLPQGQANYANFEQRPGEAAMVFLQPRTNPATGRPYELAADTLVLDPYTGAELERNRSASSLWPVTRQNLLAVIVTLHYSLLVPGSLGVWLFGIAALLWTIDCFVSAYLTFPLSARRQGSAGEATATGLADTAAAEALATRSWWARWKPSWQIKWRGSFYRVNFDVHRAGGLWIWLLLLVLAWSSVAFNLGEQVYNPVMKVVFNMPDVFAEHPTLPKPLENPPIDWQRARALGRSAMAQQAGAQGFKVLSEQTLAYMPDRGAYLYAVRSDRDLAPTGGNTFVLIDGGTGSYAGLYLPTGQNAGVTLTSWILALHVAAIWGLPYKIFLCLVGMLIAALSWTGVYIWWKKRHARRFAQARRSRSVPAKAPIAARAAES
ncbi:MAG: PepSY-associated TM helix domain-containing protein [Steroidobacteraceae bacterium]